MKEFKNQILDKPENAQLWFLFGYNKEFLNDHEGAVLAWERAFELQPQNFVTAGNLGNTYQYFLKNYPKAEFFYQRSLELQPTYTTAYQGLVDLYRYNWKENQAKIEPLLLSAIANDSENALAFLTTLVEFFAEQNDLVKARNYLTELRSLNQSAANELVERFPALQ